MISKEDMFYCNIVEFEMTWRKNKKPDEANCKVLLKGMKQIWFTWPYNDKVFFYPLYDEFDKIIGTQLWSDPEVKGSNIIIQLKNSKCDELPIKTELASMKYQKFVSATNQGISKKVFVIEVQMNE